MMTDSLVRKNVIGQVIDEGYEEDSQSPNTCPKRDPGAYYESA